jgi:Tfp pilus assembly protein PilO
MKNIDIQQLLGRLRSLDPRTLLALLIAAAVLVTAVDVLVIMRLQVALISHLDKGSVQFKTNIDTLAANKQRMAQFRTGLDQARARMQAFKAMVHQEGSVPVVLKTISTIANQSGIKIDQLVPQKSDGKVIVQNEDGSYTGLAILVRARGGYHNLGRFLGRLEQDGVFWQVDALDITADKIDPLWHVITLQLKILILGGK